MDSRDSSDNHALAFYTHYEPMDLELRDALAPFELRHHQFPVAGAAGMNPEINLLLSTAGYIAPIAVALLAQDVWTAIKQALRNAWAAKSRPRSEDRYQFSGPPLIRLNIHLKGIGNVRFDVCPENDDQFSNAMDDLLPLIHQISSSGVGYWTEHGWHFDGSDEPEPKPTQF